MKAEGMLSARVYNICGLDRKGAFAFTPRARVQAHNAKESEKVGCFLSHMCARAAADDAFHF